MRDLSSELFTFVLEHWLPFAAFTSTAPAFADDPGYILLRGELAAPVPYLELAAGIGPATGKGIHLLRFRPGPIWVDVPFDTPAAPGTLECVAQGKAGMGVVVAWEPEPDLRIWTTANNEPSANEAAEMLVLKPLPVLAKLVRMLGTTRQPARLVVRSKFGAVCRSDVALYRATFDAVPVDRCAVIETSVDGWSWIPLGTSQPRG